MTDGGAIFRASTLFVFPVYCGEAGLAWQGKSYSPVTRSYDPYGNLTFDIRDLIYRTYSLFNSYKVTDKQSCKKINTNFTCRPDPEGTAEAEGVFKEEEGAAEAKAVEVIEVVEVVEEGEIKEEPRLELKIDQRSTFFLSISSNI